MNKREKLLAEVAKVPDERIDDLLFWVKQHQWKHLEKDYTASSWQLCLKGTAIPCTAVNAYADELTGARGFKRVAANFGVPVEAIKEAIAYCNSDTDDFGLNEEMDRGYAGHRDRFFEKKRRGTVRKAATGTATRRQGVNSQNLNETSTKRHEAISR